jgi:general stress protein 26
MSEKNDKDTNYKELNGQEGMDKIASLVKDIRIAMLSTVDHDGSISSRPMATQNEPFNGTLWFLTRGSSDKVHEIATDRHVTLNYASPSDSKYIALKGKASVTNDRGKIKQLWNPMYKAWFPKGEEDPDIAVLKVEITEGDYWEANSSKLIMGFKYLAAAVTGGTVRVGEAGHVTTH